jgi:hypothetical protein
MPNCLNAGTQDIIPNTQLNSAAKTREYEKKIMMMNVYSTDSIMKEREREREKREKREK